MDCSCFCFFGAFISSVPQIIINLNHYGTFLPIIFTEQSDSSNLFIAQLVWGIKYPRYEIFIGDLSVSPVGVFFMDRVGDTLAKTQSIQSVKDYIVWIFAHLIDAVGVYTEHLISGITIFWREVYITDLKVDSAAFLINCLIYLLALLGLISGGKRMNSSFL